MKWGGVYGGLIVELYEILENFRFLGAYCVSFPDNFAKQNVAKALRCELYKA